MRCRRCKKPVIIKNKFKSTILGTIGIYFGFGYILPLSYLSVYITSYIHIKQNFVNMHYGYFLNLILTFAMTFSVSLGGLLENKLGYTFTTLLGTIIIFICNFFFFKIQNIWICYFLTLLLGVGAGITTSLLGKNLTLYHPRKKGIILSLFGMALILIAGLYLVIGEKIISPDGETLGDNEEVYKPETAERTYLYFMLGFFTIPIGDIIFLLFAHEYKKPAESDLNIPNEENVNENNINDNENKEEKKEQDEKEIKEGKEEEGKPNLDIEEKDEKEINKGKEEEEKENLEKNDEEKKEIDEVKEEEEKQNLEKNEEEEKEINDGKEEEEIKQNSEKKEEEIIEINEGNENEEKKPNLEKEEKDEKEKNEGKEREEEVKQNPEIKEKEQIEISEENKEEAKQNLEKKDEEQKIIVEGKEEEEKLISEKKEEEQNSDNLDSEIEKLKRKKKIKQVIKTFRFWKIALASFLLSFPISFMMTTGRTFGALIGIKGAALQFLTMAQGAAIIIIGPIFGILSDKKGPLLILRISSIVSILPGVLLLFFIDNTVLYMISFVFIAIGLVSKMVSFNPFLMEIYGIRESVILGGIINGIGKVGEVITVVAAFIISFKYSGNEIKTPYKIIFIVGSACSLLSLILLLFESKKKFEYVDDMDTLDLLIDNDNITDNEQNNGTNANST